MGGSNHTSDVDMDEDDDAAEDEVVEKITATEVRRQLREAKKKAS